MSSSHFFRQSTHKTTPYTPHKRGEGDSGRTENSWRRVKDRMTTMASRCGSAHRRGQQHDQDRELMKRLAYLIDGEMILKYQVVSEDLDALVSVKSDEDVGHMFDEIDRYENAGSSRLRAFLFPATPVRTENQIGCSVDSHALEQRYVDAVNGIIRTAPNSVKQHPIKINSTVQHGSLVSSGCSSPRSPDSCTAEAMNINEGITLQISNYHNCRMTNMHKVQSSPNMCGSSINVPQQGSLTFAHQISPQQYVHHYAGHQSPKPPIDIQRSERLSSFRSVGRAHGVRYQLDPTTLALAAPNYYSTSKHGYCIHHD